VRSKHGAGVLRPSFITGSRHKIVRQPIEVGCRAFGCKYLESRCSSRPRCTERLRPSTAEVNGGAVLVATCPLLRGGDSSPKKYE